MRFRLLSNFCKPTGVDASNATIQAEGRFPFFAQPELARRCRLSERTLEKWRCTKQGPAHVKLGGCVVYRVADIKAFEAQQRSASPTK